MSKHSWILLAAIVLAAAVILSIFGSNDDGAAYVSSSRGVGGTSLLFDTLEHMGYPVAVSNRPLNSRTNTSHVYIIIQPYAPPVNIAMAEEMLSWVEEGGRLIFLQNQSTTIIDYVLDTAGFRVGNLVLYQLGRGEVITGRAFDVTNSSMMVDASTGSMIEEALARWNPDRILFAEYYHGFHATENFIGGLPPIVRLILLQMVLTAAALILHLGKRFGKPITLYEETEREENEYLRALARLYHKSEKRKPRDKKNPRG